MIVFKYNKDILKWDYICTYLCEYDNLDTNETSCFRYLKNEFEIQNLCGVKRELANGV